MSLELSFRTVTEALYFEAKHAGENRGVTFIDDDGGEEVIPYLLALEEAKGTAASLQLRGVRKGAPVVLVLPTGPDFLYAFFGAMLAGAIPCPISPPTSFADLDDFIVRTRRIADYLGARAVVTTPALKEMLQRDAASGPRVIDTGEVRVDVATYGAPAFEPVEARADDVAFIQCTSGSTGHPKGVVLTHESLVSNVYQIGWSIEVRADDVMVTWLPLYHDMGVIGCLLLSIYWNIESVFMTPFRFLRRPVEWLRAIAKHRGTISPAPNFAYRLVTMRPKEQELAGLDLGSWRVAPCGAEPIDRRALEAFRERYAPYGLPRTAPCPCYGLAEATLAVTFQRQGEPFRYERISRTALAERGFAELVPPHPDPLLGGEGESTDAMEVVSCGRPLPEMRVRIVDPETGAPLPDRAVGEITVDGPTLFRGYHAHPEATAAALRGGWLHTGDVGYLAGGELYVTGRKKDIVIIRGKKYVPSDFEWAAEEVRGVRKGCVAAFGVFDEGAGTERLVLACEVDDPEAAAEDGLAARIRDAVQARTGVATSDVELLPKGAIAKTTSGKLKRSVMKNRYLEHVAAAASTATAAAAARAAR